MMLTKKYMKTTFFLAILTVCCLMSAPVKAQIFTNNGTIFSAQPGSVVLVNGNALITGGETSFGDLAELRVNGTFSLDAGLVIFNAASTGIITNDCFIGIQGELRRLGTGTLYLQKQTINKGLIINDGVIEYGIP